LFHPVQFGIALGTVRVRAHLDPSQPNARPGVTRTGASRLADRVAAFPLAWLVAAFTLAQLADLVLALVVTRELNPIARASIVGRPLLAIALKARSRRAGSSRVAEMLRPPSTAARPVGPLDRDHRGRARAR
jgi:hypothetical protein